ncbi:hypothetical protein, partial [Enterobacter cloacae complex sp. 2DZ2F20B]|uniref:hypothetical protein n=1 Tax=Enterobacter cloacae complex sp. 2DZ2F20B TaxID=2511993 RepID=UPI0013ED9665
RDLTIKQRNYTYNIRKEFRSRKTKGENDIVLKYSNGMPNIVKKKPFPTQQPIKTINMSITVQNVRGLNTKVKTFYLNALSSESDVIILSETWLREDVISEEYFGHFYDVHRCNGGYRGRGVLIAVKSTFTSRVLNLRSPVDSVDIVG